MLVIMCGHNRFLYDIKSSREIRKILPLYTLKLWVPADHYFKYRLVNIQTTEFKEFVQKLMIRKFLRY